MIYNRYSYFNTIYAHTARLFFGSLQFGKVFGAKHLSELHIPVFET